MGNLRKVRTRYAPSPTGFQHVGGIRTAIINYLIAQSMGGEFLIRIEDTDRTRNVSGAEEYILKTLKWLDISYVEGPDIGGKFAPYRQSERKEIYRKYAVDLIKKGKAYYAFDSAEELNKYRNKARSRNEEFLYNYLNRSDFVNSLTLSEEEAEQKIARGEDYVIRLNLPPDFTINFHDEIREDISVHTSQLEDKILLKSDGWPTYHLASVVDDTLMEITHVVRGEEWLPSAPIHHYLYDAFGWNNTKPVFAHLPLILNPDGDGKLSKRKLKDANLPIFPLDWINSEGILVKGLREEGFLPDAVINLLVLLGWHGNDDKEVYAREELYKYFDLKNIQRSGAKFDYSKAKWINSRHIAKSDSNYLMQNFLEVLPEYQGKVSLKRLEAAISLVKERISTLKEIADYAYLFVSSYQVHTSDINFVNKKNLRDLSEKLESLQSWNTSSINDLLDHAKNESGMKVKDFYQLVRQYLIGQEKGPEISGIMMVLGKQESIARLQRSLEEV